MLVNTIKELTTLRQAGYVRRWHTAQHVIGSQNDAEHSAQALTILFMLHPTPSVNLCKVMLWHDMGELWVGDSPSWPALRQNEDLRIAYKAAESRQIAINYPSLNEALGKLTEDDQQWIRECDLLELCMFCLDQIQAGNNNFRSIFERGIEFLHSMQTHVRVAEFTAHLQEQY